MLSALFMFIVVMVTLIVRYCHVRAVFMLSADPWQVILRVVVGIVIGKNVQDFRVHVDQRLLHREKGKS